MELKPSLPKDQRVIFLACGTPAFRTRLMDVLQTADFDPREVELQSIFEMEPQFDAEGYVFFMVEAGEDKELLHRFARHLRDQ